MAGHERANLFRVSIYQSIRARGPEPDIGGAERGGRLLRRSDRVDVRLPRQPRRVPAARAVAVDPAARPRRRRAHRRYATRNVGDTVPAGRDELRLADRHPVRVQRPGPDARAAQPLRPHPLELHDAGQRPQRLRQDDGGERDRLALHRPRRARVRPRPRRPLRGADAPGRRRAQIEIGADESPYAINPWDVDDPADVSLEKVAFLVSLHGVMMGDEGLTTLERAQLGAAIRAVYARAARDRRDAARGDAARRAARASGGGAGAGLDRGRRGAAQPRRAARRVLRRRHLRLSARPRDERSRRTARWSSSTPAAARRSCCGR